MDRLSYLERVLLKSLELAARLEGEEPEQEGAGIGGAPSNTKGTDAEALARRLEAFTPNVPLISQSSGLAGYAGQITGGSESGQGGGSGSIGSDSQQLEDGFADALNGIVLSGRSQARYIQAAEVIDRALKPLYGRNAGSAAVSETGGTEASGEFAEPGFAFSELPAAGQIAGRAELVYLQVKNASAAAGYEKKTSFEAFELKTRREPERYSMEAVSGFFEKDARRYG